MKKRQQHILWIMAGLIISVNIQAQDLHFSQYFNTPMLVNPANTGFIPDGAYRLGVNYRKQWVNLGNPYKTFSAFADGQLFGDKMENGWVGLGASLMNDVAGTGNLTSTKAVVSIAYHQALGISSLLSGGFSAGYVNKKIDFTKLTFDNQWNGKFFDITAPSNEPFTTNQVSYFTLQAGLNYAFYPNENAYMNAGISVANINRPRESFFKDGLADTRLATRTTFFLNGSFRTTDAWILNPNMYISKMTSAWEVVAGVNAQRKLTESGGTQLILGGYYRNSDAFIPLVGFQQSGFKFTFTYDATVSTLKNYNQSRGAYEFSIIKQGIITTDHGLKCPAVRF